MHPCFLWESSASKVESQCFLHKTVLEAISFSDEVLVQGPLPYVTHIVLVQGIIPYDAHEIPVHVLFLSNLHESL